MSFVDQLIRDIDTTSYIFVGGGVASGIGKGITISSIAVCLQKAGYSVQTLKIDPYLNIDAGTMNPWEHGEVFILKDGGEVDLDLGNYERYLDQNYSSDHNITSGKVYNNVIKKEREGKYMGKTVQFIPHVSQEIKDLIYNVGKKPLESTGKPPNIVLVELGGTVGDMESIIFYEAVRQIILEQPKHKTFFLLVSFVPFFSTTGEQKTKPTQNALNALRMTGVGLNYLVLRSKNPLEQSQIKKLAMFANLQTDQLLNLPDLDSVHQVPVHVENNNLPYYIMQHFKYPLNKCKIRIYQDLHLHIKNIIQKKTPVRIAVCGKYVGIEDAYFSLKKAIESAGLAADVPVQVVWIRSEYLEESHKANNLEDYNEKWDQLKSCQGIIIPGGYDLRGLQGKIATINYARTHDVPILGICYGFQAMCIEYARNIMKIKNATTYEVSLYKVGSKQENETEEQYRQRLNKSKKNAKEVYVIDDMPDAELGTLGGTMRLGQKDTFIKDKKSLAYKLYNKEVLDERYRHRFEVALDFQSKFQKAGLIFSGLDESGKRMEILELPRKKHRFFMGVQYHPEFLSRNFRPSPPFLGLIKAAIGSLDQDLKKNGKLTYDYYWTNDEV